VRLRDSAAAGSFDRFEQEHGQFRAVVVTPTRDGEHSLLAVGSEPHTLRSALFGVDCPVCGPGSAGLTLSGVDCPVCGPGSD
jgi:hypothetical protein